MKKYTPRLSRGKYVSGSAGWEQHLDSPCSQNYTSDERWAQTARSGRVLHELNQSCTLLHPDGHVTHVSWPCAWLCLVDGSSSDGIGSLSSTSSHTLDGDAGECAGCGSGQHDAVVLIMRELVGSGKKKRRRHRKSPDFSLAPLPSDVAGDCNSDLFQSTRASRQ